MGTASAASASASSTMAVNNTGVFGLIEGGSANQNKYQNISVGTFFSSVGVAFVIFSVQFFAFMLLKGKLPRIYQPRTYLVPERERTRPYPTGLWRWAAPVFRTSNSDFIQKCGLDAYFFLRYLRMLLKIFVPMALVILPILLPINAVGGRGDSFAMGPYQSGEWRNITGLDTLAWGNVRPDRNHRYWAHLVLAVLAIAYCCYVFFDELRGYIRLRQAYLTSPQHRLRASATTVLVTAIPRKWCTAEALEGLYDVFPGGIRNIWVNRNFDELSEKVRMRDWLAQKLESAETNLIKMCKQAEMKKAKKEEKESGKKRTKEEKAVQKRAQEEKAAALAESGGVSAGNLHQVHQTVDEELYGPKSSSSSSSRKSSPDRGTKSPLDAVNKGVETVGKGLATVGKTIFGGVKDVGKDIDARLQTTQGFQPDGADAEGDDGRAAEGSRPGTSRSRPAEASTAAAQPGQTNGSAASPSPQLARADNSDRQSRFEDDQSDSDLAAAHSQKTLAGDPRPGSSDVKDFAEKQAPQVATQGEPRMTPLNPRNNFHFWRQERNVLQVPSPNPHSVEGDEFPLKDMGPSAKDASSPTDSEAKDESGGIVKKVVSRKTTGSITKREDYPPACDEDYDPDTEDAVWRKYIEPKKRDTMRIPYLGWWWLFWLPFYGTKVDTIRYCRQQVARLNLEIEQDQKEPEKFPHMNSAFIQFNHQVAAHLACQAVSHHLPNQMAPRTIEIAPDDVIWDNMSVKWWERYLRTGVVLVTIVALVIAWAIPVGFTGLLSQVAALAAAYPRELGWLGRLPASAISLIQGILPPILLSTLLVLLPLVLRLLARAEGIATGMLVELALSDYYFFFVFVQVFLIVSLSSGITQVWSSLTQFNIANVPSVLATQLPKAANYFFSYLVLQAFSTSANALLQGVPLALWFLWAPLVDSTARQKWARQTSLLSVDWGTFFPLYTVFAVIGLAYSTIAPLILVFCSITFALFWFAYRFTTLYVTRFRRDTGGLLFPKAVNQLFAGLYVMELCLIGLFFVVRDARLDPETGLFVPDSDHQPCLPQGIIMIVVLVVTAIYQIMLNVSFGPLFRYLPITLEDDAVARDEAFARMQAKQWAEDDAGASPGPAGYDGPADGADLQRPANITGGDLVGTPHAANEDDIHDMLEARERQSQDEDRAAEEREVAEIAARRRQRHVLDPRGYVPDAVSAPLAKMVPGGWAERSREKTKARRVSARDNRVHRDAERPAFDAGASGEADAEAIIRQHRLRSRSGHNNTNPPPPGDAEAGAAGPKHHHRRQPAHDASGHSGGSGSGLPSQRLADALFMGLADEIEDLTPEERDALVRRAFQHEALRARRPVIWLPRDDLGVSDDEVRHTERYSGHLWISNEGAGLDGKGRVVYRRSPPDFSQLDLIEL